MALLTSDNPIILFSENRYGGTRVEYRITATELAKGLSDFLNRVRYRGERFVVERGGEPVALLEPVGAIPGITLRDLVDRMRDLSVPDEDFAEDLEEIQSSQPPAGNPGWR